MSPKRFFNLIFVLALTVVMIDCFYVQVNKLSPNQVNPLQYLPGCPGGQPKQLLYHRSAKSRVVDPSKAATRHLLYHRSAKSCYPAETCTCHAGF